MKQPLYISLIITVMIALGSCASANNPARPLPADPSEGSFVSASDGTKLFVHTYDPAGHSGLSIYVLSGYTGINHRSEKEIIGLLSGGKYRVVVIHPRGTGYSEGTRGDIGDYRGYLNDFIWIINHDIVSNNNRKIVLYGHSISTALALGIAPELNRLDGTILVNPPFKMKASEGMTPGIGDYLKYAFYMIFAPHTPIVNMAGDPAKIKNDEERTETESRLNDPLLVKYISMYVMMESKRLLDNMVRSASNANGALLLLYGAKDSIVERTGCEEIFNAWNDTNREFRTIVDGPHGRSTVVKSGKIIQAWLKKIR